VLCCSAGGGGGGVAAAVLVVVVVVVLLGCSAGGSVLPDLDLDGGAGLQLGDRHDKNTAVHLCVHLRVESEE
jgi:hypothetical protein